MPRLENKVVLVSGGASGIGAETARLVAREGGKAVVADRDEARGRALAAELGDAALFVTLDVTQEAGWQRAVAAQDAEAHARVPHAHQPEKAVDHRHDVARLQQVTQQQLLRELVDK